MVKSTHFVYFINCTLKLLINFQLDKEVKEPQQLQLISRLKSFQ